MPNLLERSFSLSLSLSLSLSRSLSLSLSSLPPFHGRLETWSGMFGVVDVLVTPTASEPPTPALGPVGFGFMIMEFRLT